MKHMNIYDSKHRCHCQGNTYKHNNSNSLSVSAKVMKQRKLWPSCQDTRLVIDLENPIKVVIEISKGLIGSF